MQKTYKCKNGHKFKKDESKEVTCPTCNETAELMKWNTVDEFTANKTGFGLMEELGSVVKDITGKKK